MPDAALVPAMENDLSVSPHHPGRQSIAGGRLSRRSRQEHQYDPQTRGIFVSPNADERR
jgi:hypothetical protein